MNKFLLLTAVAGLVAGSATMVLANEHEGHGDKKGYHGKMFEKVDADKDGAISKAESDAFHEKKFKEKDLNSDGKITQDEAKAHHEKKRAERQERREERRETKGKPAEKAAE